MYHTTNVFHSEFLKEYHHFILILFKLVLDLRHTFQLIFDQYCTFNYCRVFWMFLSKLDAGMLTRQRIAIATFAILYLLKRIECDYVR